MDEQLVVGARTGLRFGLGGVEGVQDRRGINVAEGRIARFGVGQEVPVVMAETGQRAEVVEPHPAHQEPAEEVSETRVLE